MKTFVLTLLTFLTFSVSNLLAQNVSLNSTGSNPDASAMLDVSSTTTGFLMPRMTTAQQNAIVLPAPGLTIFNTSLNTITINTGTSLSPVWSPLSAGAIDTSSIANFYTKVRSLLSSTAPITYSNGLIGITQATTSTNGYLSSTDWNTFNNKASATNSWSTTGNAGTTSATNFLGTTDSTKLIMKINNVVSGQLSPNINQEVSFGQGALNSGSGIQNTAMGYYSLSVNTGNFNTAMGNYSLLSNTTGGVNTATGHQSLRDNTSGQYNSAFGAGAMKLATTGTYNSAVGANSMGDPVTGSYNVSLGANSMRKLTSGSYNTALGESSLYNNLTGTNNTAIGRNSLSNTTGSNNVAIGFTAGSVNTTGSSNIFIGDNSQPAITALTNAIAIGSGAYVGQSNAMVLGSINGINGATSSTSIGIGNTTPSNTLHVTAATNPLRLEGLQTGAGTDQIITVDASGVLRKQTTAAVSALNAWSITGNSGTSYLTNFLGTTDNVSLRFRTNNTQGMILDSLGSVGIGTSPTFTSGTYREKFMVDAGTTTSYNPMVVQGSIDSFFQFNIQNLSAGTHASSDVVATSNNGSQTSYYVDMGINGSGNTSNIFGNSNDAYLYNQGENFFIATSTPSKSLIFMTGGTDSATNERLRITGTGNVGIGTGSPQRLFHVAQNSSGTPSMIASDNTNTTDGNGMSLSFRGTTTGLGGASFTEFNSIQSVFTTHDNATRASSLKFYTSVAGVLAERMRISTAGYMGIGTGAPTNALHVFAATNPVRFEGLQTGAGTDQIITVDATGVLRKQTTASVSALNAWSITGNSGTSYLTNFLGTTDNVSLRFRTNNTQGMILDSLGSVGIGTAPAFTSGANREKLLVDAGSGSINAIAGTGSINSYLQLNIRNTNSGTTASSDVVATNDAGTEANLLNFVDMGINSSGNTSTGVLGGINTGYLYSTGSDFVIGNATASKNLLLFTGGTAAANERMRIDGSGNVGIANTSPSEKLDVTGNVKFSGALMPNNLPGTAGYILTSSGAGAAPTWVSGQNIVTLGSDVINNNVTANTIADVTGLSFAVTAGVTYRFSALIIYTAAATSTGSRWAINGPASPTLLSYKSVCTNTTTSESITNASAYDLPAASNAASANTAGNICTIIGIITPSANGTVIVRFASEIASSAITAKAGSTLTWW